MQRSLNLALITLILVAASGDAIAIIIPSEIVAKQGSSVESVYGNDVTLADGLFPSLNNNGAVVFAARLRGMQITSDDRNEAIIAYRDDRFDTIAHEGTLPSISTIPLGGFDGRGAIIDDYDRISFGTFSIRNFGVNSPYERILWTENGVGSLVPLLVQNRVTATNITGQAVDYHLHGRNGDIVAISSNNFDGTNPIGVYYGSATGVQLSVQKDDLATGLGGPNIFESFSSASVNGHGDYRFNASHPSSFEPNPWGRGIWGGRKQDSIMPSAITGFNADGLIPGAIRTGMSNASINNRGDLAYAGSFSTPSTLGRQLERGIYLDRNGAINPLIPFESEITVGDKSVTIGDRTTFVLGGSGMIAAHVEETDLSDQITRSAIYKSQIQETPVRIARDGDHATGLGDGVFFDLDSTRSMELFMNADSTLIFFASLTGNGVNDSNNEAVFLSTADNELIPILRKGELIDVSETSDFVDARFITQINWLQSPQGLRGSGGQDGRRSLLNDYGQVVLDITYTSGNGIFLFDLPNARLSGDFNSDGVVDAADYTVWRRGFGSKFTAADYRLWKSNYGNRRISAGTALRAARVPEPSSIIVTALLILAFSVLHRTRSVNLDTCHR